MPACLNLPDGLHVDITDEQYHGDLLTEGPTLSRSLASTLIYQSPLHAYYEHPRLGGKPAKPEGEDAEAAEPAEPVAAADAPTRAMDYGDVAHKLLLGVNQDMIAVGEWKTWQSKDAKKFREDARAAGKTPILAAQFEKAKRLFTVARQNLSSMGMLPYLDAALSHPVALFSEGDVRCRVQFDKLLLVGDPVIFDFKITGSANPKVCERQIQNMHYDLQDSTYRTACQRLWPTHAGREKFIFIFIEQAFPHAITPMECDGAFRTNGTAKWNHAVAVWRECMRRGQWPAYTNETIKATPADWALAETFGLKMPTFTI